MTPIERLATSANLEQTVANLLDGVDAPGAVVAFTLDGEMWTSGIGFTDLERTAPIGADARFSAYSITKTIIATLILRLVEGKDSLVLYDTLQAHLPGFPIATPIPIHHVLNHTSGLPSYGLTSEYHEAVRANPGTPWSDDEFVTRTMGDELLFLPGQRWHYSNIGFLYLRQLLEQETGLTFPQIVRGYLGYPLGLPSFSGAANLDDAQSLTPGYSTALSFDRTLENVIPRYHPGWVSHGLVTSTASDLARFLDLLFGGEVLDAALLEEMLIGAPVGEVHPWMVKPAYGLGLMMDTAHRFGVVAGHTGGGPGYSTAAYHFPDVHGHRVSAVALVNRDGSDVATDIVFSLVDVLAERIS